MEPKTTARKTAAKTAPKGATAAKATKTATAPKATAKTAPKTAPRGTKATKATAAKATAPKATGPRLTGPTPERAKLAKTVAGLRAKGTKWNEIAVATGKSEPTLAKLRKDVRAGVFAKISPVSARVPADAF